MGDIFDFLSGESKFFIQENSELITLINKLSDDFEIYYFEGNHDFNLAKLFPNITIFTKQNQPVVFEFQQNKIALSHGDNLMGLGYDIFCAIIRNSALLKFLNFIDIGFWLSQKIKNHLNSKNICIKYKMDENKIARKIANLDANIVAEGHFHQDFSFQIKNHNYVNFPAFACGGKICVFNDGKFNSFKLAFN